MTSGGGSSAQQQIQWLALASLGRCMTLQSLCRSNRAGLVGVGAPLDLQPTPVAMTCACCSQAFWHVSAAAALCCTAAMASHIPDALSPALPSKHSAPVAAASHDASQQAVVLQRHVSDELCSASPFCSTASCSPQKCPAAAWSCTCELVRNYLCLSTGFWQDPNIDMSMLVSADIRQ